VVSFKAALRKRLAKARSLRLEGSVLVTDSISNKARRKLAVLKLAR
jgi:hypothetical protein